jgi:hypothetical protein
MKSPLSTDEQVLFLREALRLADLAIKEMEETIKQYESLRITKEQLDKIRNKLFQQQDKPCKEGEPTFHEALGFESGMIFMCQTLGLDWREISKR